MSRTKTCNISVRNPHHFLRRFGRGKKFFTLLLSISNNYKRFFPIEPPYTVSVTYDECGIKFVTFKRDDYELTFMNPQYNGVEYTFDSIKVKNFGTLFGNHNLTKMKEFNRTGFHAYIAYIGIAATPEKIKFPYHHAFEDLSIKFKHNYTKMSMYCYVEACEELHKEFCKIFKESKPFKFIDFLNSVLKKFNISIEELKELKISGILNFSNGIICQATSYTGEYLTTISQNTEKLLSPMCRYSTQSITTQKIFVSSECYIDNVTSSKKKSENFVVQKEGLSQTERDKLYQNAEEHLTAFIKEVTDFNSKSSKESKSSGT